MLRLFLRSVTGLLCLAVLALPALDPRTPVASAEPASQSACNGDEYLAFNPYGPAPVAGRDLYIIVSSVYPAAYVDLSGPLEPDFAGAGHDFRQRTDGTWEGVNTWTWKVTPPEPDRYVYTFSVGRAICATAAIEVGQLPLSPERDLVLPAAASAGPCNGDEYLAFNPYGPTPGAGRDVYVIASSVHPAANVDLSGPFKPEFGGVGWEFRQRPDGRWEGVYTWTWKVTPPEPGRYDYAFSADGTVCTARAVQVEDTAAALGPAAQPR